MPISIPPFTNVPAPNDPVASAWAQQLTRFAVDNIVVQPGTPASADTELWYDTDDVLPVPAPSQMPRGYVGYQRNVSAVNVTAPSVITSLGVKVSWTADPTRRYKTTVLSGRIDQAGAASIDNVRISDVANGTNIIARNDLTLQAGEYGNIVVMAVESGLSGAIFREGFIFLTAGTAVVQSLTLGSQIIVEDIGGL